MRTLRWILMRTTRGFVYLFYVLIALMVVRLLVMFFGPSLRIREAVEPLVTPTGWFVLPIIGGPDIGTLYGGRFDVNALLSAAVYGLGVIVSDRLYEWAFRLKIQE